MKSKFWIFASLATVCIGWLSLSSVLVKKDGTGAFRNAESALENAQGEAPSGGTGTAVPEKSGAPAAPKNDSSAAIPAAAAAPVTGYLLKGVASGVPLSGYTGTYLAGQKGVVQSFTPNPDDLRNLQVGGKMDFPLPFGARATGTILSAQKDKDGVLHFGGTLDGQGYFYVAAGQPALTGHLIFPQTRMAYTLEVDSEDGGAEQLIVERRMESVICDVIPLVEPPLPYAAIGGQATIAFNSLPEAEAVLYIDFEGGLVDDPLWTRYNGGKVIDAQPQGQTPEGMLEIAQRVAEDFAPFSINVTTERNRYNAAPVNKRMRCIVTATSFGGGWGGVAYLSSFGESTPSGAGRVCWAFNGGIQPCAATISHEVGHTFGLNHDG